ncbi:hypothetical protein I552_1286 [Mycobacterium xenopi 3993]|nr:hypothetical protein I552_1286 [Mycobacterium xenopi 3993]
MQAALLYALPPLPEPRADRPARENLLAVFTAHCDVLAGKTAFPAWISSVSSFTNRS